jgi:hypothetical protein
MEVLDELSVSNSRRREVPVLRAGDVFLFRSIQLAPVCDVRRNEPRSPSGARGVASSGSSKRSVTGVNPKSAGTGLADDVIDLAFAVRPCTF